MMWEKETGERERDRKIIIIVLVILLLFNGFNWDERANREYTHKSCKKAEIPYESKELLLLFWKTRKKQTHSGTRVPQYIYNCCYRKGEQMNFAVGLLFLKIQCVFFLLFSYSSANLSWNLHRSHPNKKREKAFMIEVSNQNISPATT